VLSFHYGLTSDDAAVDEVLLPEWFNIRFALRGDWQWQPVGGAQLALGPASLCGASSRGARIMAPPGASMIGFGLLPLGWALLSGGAASQFADRVVPLADIWPELAALHPALVAAPDMASRVEMLEAAVMARLEDAPPAPPLLAEIDHLLNQTDVTTTAALAARLGISLRTLERLCEALLGFGPKRLMRRQRFLRTVDSMLGTPDPPLSALIAGDYVDQSHFIREFRAFMGLSPTEYLALPREVMRRAARARWHLQGQSVPAHAPR
jgi:AraC-like DNA-binding protein